jgi:PEGA domain
MKRVAVLACVAAFVAVGCAHEERTPKQAPEKEETAATETPPAGETQPVAPASGVTVPPTQPGIAPPPKPRPPKIKIIVRSNPPKANVFWGKKNLGPTPVTLERPRDSGPVDLVVRQDGYIPVHTRAYTVRNDAVYVKMTKVEDRMTLFGAKRDLNEPAPTAPAGVAPEAEAPPANPPPSAPAPSAPPPQ